MDTPAERGVTLIELLVVIAIMAILLAVGVPSLSLVPLIIAIRCLRTHSRATSANASSTNTGECVA